MEIKAGDIVLQQVAGVDLMVEVSREKDSSGFVIVKRDDLPQYPVLASPKTSEGDLLSHRKIT